MAYTFRDWEVKQMKDPSFRRAVRWYKITHFWEPVWIHLHIWLYSHCRWYRVVTKKVCD